MTDLEYAKSKVGLVKDFPKKGINFRDITPCLDDPKAWRIVCDVIAERYKDKKIDCVLGLESRGFMFAGAIAYLLNAGCLLIRKKGKLPGKVVRASYEKEYGVDEVEIREGSIVKGANCLIVDDLIATGGTLSAAESLVTKCGGNVVECVCMIELPELNGKEKVKSNVHVLMEFPA